MECLFIKLFLFLLVHIDCNCMSFSLIANIIRKNKKHLNYPSATSSIKPVAHGPGIPIPSQPQNLGTDSSSDDDKHLEGQPVVFINTYQHTGEVNQPKPLNQAELSDLTRDLCSPKELAQLLGSR